MMEKLQQQRDAWAAGEEKLRAWHAQTREDALEPDLEIVDAHHHLYDYRQLMGYNLMGMFKQQYYMTEELLDDVLGAGHRVVSTVYVEAHAFYSKDVDDPAVMAPLGEVQHAQGVAAQFASGAYGDHVRGCAAIVGGADLAGHGAAVEPLLAACKARCPNYRGIRQSATHDPHMEGNNFARQAGMYASDTFREGFALLAKHDLSFDAWVYASQLAEFRDLARAFPETTIVLCHAGTPACGFGNVDKATAYDGKQEEIMTSWREELTRVAAECPNVYVKVGAAAIPQTGAGFESRDKPPTSREVADTFGDAYMWVVKTFGPDRCMFESNFPVDKVSLSYGVLWNAFKIMTKNAGLSDDERTALFSGTAKKVYRI